MKKTLLLSLIIAFGTASLAEAQLRENASTYNDYTGAVIKTQSVSSSSGVGDWMNMLNMTMSHSYSMTFSNVGGQFQNLNAYTNHMMFDFSENLTGHLDISLLHSPFGNSFMNLSGNALGTQIIIDRAQLDYQISPNTNISIQFSQRPYTYSPFGMGRYRGMHQTGNHFWY